MIKQLSMACQIKQVGDEMTFSAYGNTKNDIDLVRDVAVDGCYTKSIDTMRDKGRFAKLLWGHDRNLPPVGVIKHMEEDTKGLLIEGRLSKTPRGQELYVLSKDEAIDSFSMGYHTIKENYDHVKDINYLQEVDVKEVSFVNFACNENSLMQTIKSHLQNGEMPSIRDMERIMRDHGFSRKEATAIASCYAPKEKSNVDIKAIVSHPFFS